jgi:hypothetical protein
MANLRITELDFDTIKSNLKDYLKNYTDDDGAPYFTDFDFEGSGISILLDVLSYNTHYNAYLASMVVNDMFLDSAVKRSSAVSLAKHMGYTPVSTRGAKATLTFTVSNPTNTPNFLTLEQYTPFSTTIDENALSFVNLNAVTIQPVSGVYTFTDIEIVEGIPLIYTYSVDTPGPAEKYIIPNDNVDTSTIKIIVQNSSVDTTQTVYTLAEDTIGVDGTSGVFFLEEASTGRFQIYFGDGIIGKLLTPGNLVSINYLISNGTLGNVSGNIDQLFTVGASIGGGSVAGSITATVNSRGGMEKEGLDSIKFRAPKYLASLNRAVTSADYKSLIESNYPLVESISVWGGDENDPPKYGKVIISLKPYNGYEITSAVKTEITNTILQNKQVLSITPEFIDPEYFYVNLDVKVKYNFKTTSYSSTNIQNLVVNTIQDYFSTNLQQFGKDFIFSKLSKDIDNTDTSIIGNLMTVRLQKRIDPILNSVNNNYILSDTIKFKNGLVPGSIGSTRFIVNNNGGYLDVIIKDVPDDAFPNNAGSGTLQLINADTAIIINSNYGTVKYDTGDIQITSLELTGYPENTNDVRIIGTVQDSSLDIVVNNNQILLLDDSTFGAAANRLAGLIVSTIAITE